jgi:CheY-like chemotaxis protein
LAANAAPTNASERATILLVEDNEQVRGFTAEMLAALGYRVMLASKGREALQALTQNEHIDLLFTDVGLPDGMNGRQLAEEARRIRPELKVLFTTGYSRNAIVHHGRLDPGVELILKPFTETKRQPDAQATLLAMDFHSAARSRMRRRDMPITGGGNCSHSPLGCR